MHFTLGHQAEPFAWYLKCIPVCTNLISPKFTVWWIEFKVTTIQSPHMSDVSSPRQDTLFPQCITANYRPICLLHTCKIYSWHAKATCLVSYSVRNLGSTSRLFILYGTHHCVTITTSANGNIFRVTGPFCGEFTGHQWIPRKKSVTGEFPAEKPMMRSLKFFFDLRLNERLSKQSWG